MIKCIVWDLDQTLWKGVLAEGDEPSLNKEAYDILMEADSRGIIQSIASRNEPGEALKMLGKMGIGKYFIYPQIGRYIVKQEAMKDISARFNIGLDAMAFIDDDDFERYEVTRYLPGVNIYSVKELDILMQAVQNMPSISASRRQWMEAREARLEAETTFCGTRDQFLTECKMELSIRRAGEADMPRVKELLNRASRFNTVSNINIGLNEYIASPNKCLVICELTDIFGIHGIIGAALLKGESNTLYIDAFCVSCRVEGRGVAATFLNEILCSNSINEKYTQVICQSRGVLPALLFKSAGFEHKGDAENDTRNNDGLYVLKLPHIKTEIPWIKAYIEQ